MDAAYERVPRGFIDGVHNVEQFPGFRIGNGTQSHNDAAGAFRPPHLMSHYQV
jgi:hypothetical protein